MAKAKKEKGKKGGGKKGKKESEVIDPNVLTEVDKTFYELQITDLNRKLARLRSLTEELELKNEELQNNLKTMDEDRGDIITYLKKTLQEKSDEITDLQNRLQALQEKRQAETEDFQNQISDMQQEYKMMQEQLTSEIKLLNGKLNSLEEFRIQRDDLMKKYEIQEAAMEEQELRHKQNIYEIEKKFIISKDRLKKEMEDKLLQLSCDFQDATNLRIAATTHRVIRENIAINNELDVILETHAKLHSENDSLKERDKLLRMEAEIHESEKNKALAKAKVQRHLIERLTSEHEKMSKKLEQYENINHKLLSTREELYVTQRKANNLQLKNKILEQNIHASRCDRVALKTDLQYAEAEIERLTEIIVQAAISIKEALKLVPTSDEATIISKREILLVNLLSLLSTVYEKQPRKPSLDSVGSCSDMYRKGDLGFVPVSVEVRSKHPTQRNIDAQVGASLEDLIAKLSEAMVTERKEVVGGEEEETVASEEISIAPKELDAEDVKEESRSQTVFDDEPEPLSASSEHAVAINVLDLVDTKQADIDQTLRDGDELESSLGEGEEIEEFMVEGLEAGQVEGKDKPTSKVNFEDQ